MKSDSVSAVTKIPARATHCPKCGEKWLKSRKCADGSRQKYRTVYSHVKTDPSFTIRCPQCHAVFQEERSLSDD